MADTASPWTGKQTQEIQLAAYQAGWDAGLEETLVEMRKFPTKVKADQLIPKTAPTPQSSYSNNSSNCREALKWTATMLSRWVEGGKIFDDVVMVMDSKERTVGEIPDMADAVSENK